jgi:ribosomal protein L32
MSVPPKRRPRATVRERASHFALEKTTVNSCSKCGQAVKPNYACPVCGAYKGKESIKVKSKIKTEKKTKGK